MLFNAGHIARESVQVKEKMGKGRAGPSPEPTGGGSDSVPRRGFACSVFQYPLKKYTKVTV